jgi:hypothetical protein
MKTPRNGSNIAAGIFTSYDLTKDSAALIFIMLFELP